MKATCPACEKTIKYADDLAGKKAKCPACGNVLILPKPEPVAVQVAGPSVRRRWTMPVVLAMLVLVSGGFFVSTMRKRAVGEAPQQQQTEQPAGPVVQGGWDAFKNNAARAIHAAKTAQVEESGIITAIGENFLVFENTNGFAGNGTKCYFRDVSPLLNLSAWQYNAVVRGEYVGWDGHWLTLKNCTLISTKDRSELQRERDAEREAEKERRRQEQQERRKAGNKRGG